MSDAPERIWGRTHKSEYKGLTVASLRKRNNYETEYTRADLPAPQAGAWRDGEPPKPWREEWFIAETTYGDRVVLRSLPEEYTYDYETADGTYIKADKIKRWMQFPDSQYIAPPGSAKREVPAPQVRELIEAAWAYVDARAREKLPRSHYKMDPRIYMKFVMALVDADPETSIEHSALERGKEGV